jgi:hydrophobic/amphiphilic exporter-1 (mainly G- bacteria), HAE1 family
MKRWIELFIARPIFTWVLVLSVVVLGINGLGKMPVERFPSIEFGFVSVTVAAPGLSSEQVEAEISTRVENALGTIGGLERLDSISFEGMALVTAQFSLSKKEDVAANEVRDRVARLADELPPQARPARIETFNVNGTPVLLIALDSPRATRTPIELTELADTQLRRELQSVKGVGEVRLLGGETRALSIVLDPTRLLAHDLTGEEVRQALLRENLEAPGGTLADGPHVLGLRLAAKAKTLEQLEAVVVAKRGAASVRLADVARVIDGPVASDSLASWSGRPAVVLAVTKQPFSNTVALVDDIRARLKVAQQSLPDGVEARVVQDNSEDIRASVFAVAEHLILGALLAAAVVLLFLRSWRATLIAGLAIPASVIGTFMVAQAIGMSLNLLSLLGLTLAVGIVIDDAIVVVENIMHAMHERKLDARAAAAEATREIALAVVATTLSLVAVFLPVATMEGIVGRYLAPFGLTMSASILISMLIAFTLTPMLSSRWLKRTSPVEPEAAAVVSSTRGGLTQRYGAAVRWLLARRWVAAVALVVTLASIVPLGAVLPATFIPVEDSARVAVYVRLPERATVERTGQIALGLAERARAFPHVKGSLITTLSRREAVVTVYLAKRGVQAETLATLRRDLQTTLLEPEALLMVSPSDDLTLPGPDGAAIQFVLRGSQREELDRVASRMLEASKGVRGTLDHGLSSGGGRPELAISVDRARASELGVSHGELGAALALVDRKGLELGSMRDPRGGREVNLKVFLRVASDGVSHDDLVRTVTVRGGGGSLVSLSDLAHAQRTEGPGVIRRVGRQRQVTLFMNTAPGTSDAEVVSALQQKLREIEPSQRVTGEVIGNAKEMEKAFSAFLVAVVLSFVFMYLILAAQFESWVHPVTILVSLPLTVPFGLVSLWVGGQTLNLFSALGFLVLFGVVKKNSILLVDRTIQLRSQGLASYDAVVQACQDRLRPILMTTIAFVAGMIPLVVSSGAGAATNRAISVGVLGGQTLSLALTLLVTPVVYTWLDELQVRWGEARIVSRISGWLARHRRADVASRGDREGVAT